MKPSFEDPEARADYFRTVINQGEKKGQTRGACIVATLPARHVWLARIKAYAPGCMADTPVPGTSGTAMCGGTVDGKRFFCPNCEPKPKY